MKVCVEGLISREVVVFSRLIWGGGLAEWWALCTIFASLTSLRVAVK